LLGKRPGRCGCAAASGGRLAIKPPFIRQGMALRVLVLSLREIRYAY
jgi:hypothetical protein